MKKLVLTLALSSVALSALAMGPHGNPAQSELSVDRPLGIMGERPSIKQQLANAGYVDVKFGLIAKNNGKTVVAFEENGKPMAARFLESGLLDTSFGVNGILDLIQ